MALAASRRPRLLEGITQAAEYSQNGGGIWVADPAFILPMGHIQSMMSAIFHTPSLLFDPQPLCRVQLAPISRGG